MDLRKMPVSFADDRGEIIDILDKIDTDCATLITFTKGARRGDHYHKISKQYLYVISGKMLLITQDPGAEPEQAVVEARDLAYTPPMEKHAFLALEDSVAIVFTSGPRGGKSYEDDTYRLETKLPVKE